MRSMICRALNRAVHPAGPAFAGPAGLSSLAGLRPTWPILPGTARRATAVAR